LEQIAQNSMLLFMHKADELALIVRRKFSFFREKGPSAGIME
jgi:hypothetical protein